MSFRPSRVAVLAHFDIEGKIPPHTRLLIDELQETVDRLVVVSTRLDPAETHGWNERIRFITRPNVGYDFYSLKVGLESVGDLQVYDELIIANDSVFMVRPGGYRAALAQMAEVECDAWSLTVSQQISAHMQSYFMVFRKRCLMSKCFRDFWRDVRVIDSKWEIILGYEIGLSQRLQENGFVLKSAFNADMADIKLLMSRIGHHATSGKKVSAVSDANLVHYLWDRIFDQYGVIKNEVLRDDPNRVLNPPLSNVVGKEMASRIHREMDRVRSFRSVSVAVGQALTSDWDDPSLVRYKLPGLDVAGLHARVAVVLHLYHVDLLEEICAYLKNILMPFDLFVSVKSVEDYFAAFAGFRRLGVTANIYLHENRGRDVGPFISLLNSGLLDRYTCVCKIHSKKSVYHQAGNRWRDDLFSGLLGSPYDVLRIVRAFEQYLSCGVVGSDSAFVTDGRFWGGNEARMCQFANEIDMPADKVRLGFFAGTMFWFRPAAFDLLKRRAIALSEFEEEAGQRDATLAHVLERMFTLCAEEAGYYISTTRMLSGPLNEADYADRRVPVLPS